MCCANELNEGVCLFNVRKMWDKLVLAARAIAAIENPADVCIISARQIAQRAVLKYARYTGKHKTNKQTNKQKRHKAKQQQQNKLEV